MRNLAWLWVILCAGPIIGWGQQTQSRPPLPGMFNVLDFGANPDGKSLNTRAIGAAVSAASKSGGGRVVFPPGIYVTGTFRLASNITVELQAGAVIQGSKDLADYGDITAYGLGRDYGRNSSGEGTKVGIVFARNVENVSIIGPGVIDGNGDSFFDRDTPHFSMDFDPSATRQGQRSIDVLHMTSDGPIAAKPSGRPGTMVICFDCKNVVIRDVTFRNAPNWTAHFQNVERAVVSGLHVLNNPLIPNNDGFDCFGCKDVHFSDCDIHTGDDDFAIVNSVDLTVANCTLSSRSSGIRLEASQFNTFENLTIHSNRGIAIYERGFGKTDHISFANIRMETQLFPGHWWGKGEPIYIAVGKPQTAPGSGEISNITFSNISGDAESSVVLYGHPDAWLRNIRLDDVHFTLRTARKDVSELVGGNFDFRWTASNLKEAVYKHDIPGVYGRYVDGLHIQNSSIAWCLSAFCGTSLRSLRSKSLDLAGSNKGKEELTSAVPNFFSSAIELEDFRNVELNGFRGSEAPESAAAAISLRNGNGISIRNGTAALGTRVFLEAHNLQGKRLLMNSDVSNARTVLKNEAGQFTQSGNYLGKRQPGTSTAH